MILSVLTSACDGSGSRALQLADSPEVVRHRPYLQLALEEDIVREATRYEAHLTERRSAAAGALEGLAVSVFQSARQTDGLLSRLGGILDGGEAEPDEAGFEALEAVLKQHTGAVAASYGAGARAAAVASCRVCRASWACDG